MHWNRRRPKWPILAALVGLFALTLLAPSSWQRSPSVRSPFDETPQGTAQDEQPTLAPLTFGPTFEPVLPEPEPALPPLAEPAVEPSLAGPMVIADDYVAVNEPLKPVEPIEPTPPAVEPAATDAAPPFGPELTTEGSPVAEGFTLRPQRRSVLIRNVAAPDQAAPPMFTVESLTRVRDALSAIVQHARQIRAPAAASPSPAQRVMVENADDRLAMIPPRNHGVPQPELAPLERPTPATEPIKTEPTIDAGQPALRHRPAALITQLEELAAEDTASHWAEQVLTRVDRLCEPAEPDHDWQPTLAELGTLAERGFSDALKVSDPAEQSAWIRATRALDRRLPVWSLLLDREHAAQASAGHELSNNDDGLMRILNEVAAMTAGAGEGATWRAYLRIDDLAGLTSVGGEEYVEQRRATSRDVLLRMASPWLSAAQRQFLAQPPLVTLAAELRPWASGEASIDTLAAFIERYESNGSLRDADAIAELRLRMKWSADARLQALAEELNRHYRNANLRIALSGELMNRWIPAPEPVSAAVRSRIAGADVRGRSQTETEIKVRLLPDPTVWRFGLEAYGIVSSRTTSQTWPARLRNASQMEYEARKLVLVNRFGLHVFPSEARADGNTRLVGVESTFEAVPIIGALVEDAAREQHRASRSRAIAQVKTKVGHEARERMDREADAKLARLRQRYREHVQEPLQRFALTAEPVDMSTTAERASARLRLAGEQHLAAHTPRPSAPSDSLASFQLHESVFNNAVRGLGLDGKRMTVGELHALLAQKIRRHAEAEPADLPKAAKVEFAAHDAVRVACNGDRVELILNIVELRHGRDSIRGVGVHAFFRPVIDGLEVKLVRDGTLQFRGPHLRTGPRMVLHGVFGKLLPKDQEVPVLAAKLSDDPRLAGLMVTQLVIDDGWVGLSVGPATPHRTAWRTRGVERR